MGRCSLARSPSCDPAQLNSSPSKDASTYTHLHLISKVNMRLGLQLPSAAVPSVTFFRTSLWKAPSEMVSKTGSEDSRVWLQGSSQASRSPSGAAPSALSAGAAHAACSCACHLVASDRHNGRTFYSLKHFTHSDLNRSSSYPPTREKMLASKLGIEQVADQVCELKKPSIAGFFIGAALPLCALCLRTNFCGESTVSIGNSTPDVTRRRGRCI